MRPIRGINSIKREGVLSSDNITNENAVMWWKYAIKCVIKSQKEKKGSIVEFRMSKEKKREYEKKFIKLFKKYLLNEYYDEDELHHIIVAVDKSYLEKWVTVITKRRVDQETKKQEESSWMNYFKRKAVEEEKKDDDNISAEEIESVYKTLYEQFLKDDQKEEVKDPATVKTFHVELLVVKGGLNLIYDKVNMQLYFHDIGLKYKQYGDGRMIIDAQTRDFGLDMKSDQHFDIIEKMDESEVFWEMNYLKNPPGNEIEHSLNLVINPIKIIYEGSFIKTIVRFFKNESDLQIKEQAAEKWADFKEGAGTQIQESIKAGRKDIKICIFSPIFLIPLINNDPNSKMWAINLGNFSLASERPKDDYENYSFSITSMMIKFYKNYETWQECANNELLKRKQLKEDDIPFPDEEVTLDPENFTLLEEFQIESQLGVSTSAKTAKGKSDIEILAYVTPVKFNLNNTVFNHLVNIHRCFTYEDPEEIVVNMIKDKEKVMSKAKLITSVKKRGNNIKIFAKRYSVISGSYLYFYRESNDLVEEESLFLKDAFINDVSNTVGEKYALELTSKFGYVMVAFNSMQAKDKWTEQIRQIVREMNLSADSSNEIAEKVIRQEQMEDGVKVFNLLATCSEVKLKWYELSGSQFISANLSDLSLKVMKPVSGIKIYLGIGSGDALNHSDVPNLKTIATSQRPEESSTNFIELEIELNEKPENPSGDEIIVNIRVGYLILYFFPPIIKDLLTRVRRIRYENEYDIEIYKSQHKARIEKLESQIIKAINTSEVNNVNAQLEVSNADFTSHNCEKFPYPYIIVRAALLEVEADFLHHIYATPLAKIKIGQTNVDYDMYVDHDDLNGTLGGIRVYDMTNYPYTIDPRKHEDFSKVKMFEILGLRDPKEKNTLSLDCRFFSDTCPRKPNKRKNLIKLYVASIKYIFQLDYLMRIKDFFFERLLDSVTETNPYADQQELGIEQKLIRFRDSEEVAAFDLNQEDSIIELHVEAKNPCIILRARNHYTEEFTICLGDVHVSSELIIEKNKWALCPKKEVRVCSFLINIEETTFSHRDGKMGKIKLLDVNVKQLVNSDSLEYVDPLALNKAM